MAATEIETKDKLSSTKEVSPPNMGHNTTSNNVKGPSTMEIEGHTNVNERKPLDNDHPSCNKMIPSDVESDQCSSEVRIFLAIFVTFKMVECIVVVFCFVFLFCPDYTALY